MRWLPLICAAVLIIGFSRLGFWQLSREQEKIALLAGFSASLEAPARTLDPYTQQPRFTRVALPGQFTDRQVLIDNQMRAGQIGLHVLTLFQPRRGAESILVNRGWLPMRPDRRQLPEIPPPPVGPVTVTGHLSNYPRPGLMLGQVDYSAPAPWLVPYVEPDLLARALKIRLTPQILLATAGAGTGLVQSWQPQVMGAERHRGYALQWFSLAGAVLVVTLIVQWRRKA